MDTDKNGRNCPAGFTITTLHKPSKLALPWRAAGAASDERLALATMKAANERAKIGRTKCLIDLLRFLIWL